MGGELRRQIGEQRQRIGELAREELLHRLRRGECGEAHSPCAREKQRRREAAIGVWQRNQHEATPRPDVQRVPLECTGRPRGYGELLVVVVEPLLAHL